MVSIMTTNNTTTTTKLKDRKQRNLMDSSREELSQIASLSCKFTPPYADQDALNEKIRMNTILGEHPTFSGKPTNVITNENQETNNLYLNKLLNLKSQQKHVNLEENLVDNNFSSNQSPLFKSLEKTINYDDTLNKIFQKMKVKPLIKNISDYFIKETNSDHLDLSEDEEEIINNIDENIKTTSDASNDFLTNDKPNNNEIQFPLSSSSQTFTESPSESIQSSEKSTLNSSPESEKSNQTEDTEPRMKKIERTSSVKFVLDLESEDEQIKSDLSEIYYQKPAILTNGVVPKEVVEEKREEVVSQNNTQTNNKPLQVKDLNEELVKSSENESLDKKIDLDENGKPMLIVSIEFDLLKYCSGILSLDLNGKNLDILKYKSENSENINNKNEHQHQAQVKQQYQPPELKKVNSNLKRSSPSIVDGQSEFNNKKIKIEDSNTTNNNPKIKQTNPNKLSNNTSQSNPTAIVKPMSITKPPNQIKPNIKQKLGLNYDFLYNELSEETFHNRGIDKKHEADSERESPIKKVRLYMEAVCYFCLCAINQHRFKKTKTVKSIELLNQTWKLLKHINEIALKTKNVDFTKKFKVLSNWMESFIFHWLWRLNLTDSKKLSTSLNSLIHSLNTPSNTTPNSIRNNSPSEMLQSPNSVCSAGSQNGHVVNNTESRSQSQPNELSLLRELHSKAKNFLVISDFNIRSQSRWDENEAYISADKHLLDYKEAIKTQVQFQLYLNCEVEEFVSSVFSGLQLLELNSLN